MRPTAVLLAIALAAPLHGGIVYDFVTTRDTGRGLEQFTGRVWIDGARYRAENDSGTARQIVISIDGDETATIIDPRSGDRHLRRAGETRSSRLFLWPMPGPYVSEGPYVTYSSGGRSIVAGQECTEHVIDILFRVQSRLGVAPVAGQFHAVAHVWATEALPAVPMQKGIRTGYLLVDREIDEAQKNVRGLVLRHSLEISRTFDGGVPQTEQTTTTITRIEERVIPDEQFAP